MCQGPRRRCFVQLCERPLEHQFTTEFATTWADVEQVVSSAHNRFFMLDDQQCVAFVAQRMHDLDEPSSVTRVQADARFVEHKQRIYERRTEAGGQVHAFDLSAGERARRAIEIQVAQPDAFQIPES